MGEFVDRLQNRNSVIDCERYRKWTRIVDGVSYRIVGRIPLIEISFYGSRLEMQTETVQSWTAAIRRAELFAKKLRARMVGKNEP